MAVEADEVMQLIFLAVCKLLRFNELRRIKWHNFNEIGGWRHIVHTICIENARNHLRYLGTPIGLHSTKVTSEQFSPVVLRSLNLKMAR